MGNGYKAKICGTTSVADARLAADHGADFFGVVVEVGFSPRSLSIDEALPLFRSPPVPGVALVFEMAPDRVRLVMEKLKPYAVQFLGRTDPSLLRELKQERPSVRLWQSIHLPESGAPVAVDDFVREFREYVEAGADALLFDTAVVSDGKMKFGGTGTTSDWDVVKELMKKVKSPVPVWLAGGIDPGNVGAALDAVDPYGIDLCSGVEASPGKKDPEKVRALMETIREKSKTRREQT